MATKRKPYKAYVQTTRRVLSLGKYKTADEALAAAEHARQFVDRDACVGITTGKLPRAKQRAEFVDYLESAQLNPERRNSLEIIKESCNREAERRKRGSDAGAKARRGCKTK